MKLQKPWGQLIEAVKQEAETSEEWNRAQRRRTQEVDWRSVL